MLEEKAYKSLWRALRSIETNDKGPGGHPSQETTLTAIGRAWEVVDMVHRARGLVGHVPLLRKNTKEVQIFLRLTSSVEEFRNLFQHLNTEISKIRGEFSPIMGAISWTTREPGRSITIMTGSSAEDTKFHTLAFDMRRRQFSNQLVLGAGLKDVDLFELHSRCRSFRSFFERWLVEQQLLSKKDQSVGIVRFDASAFVQGESKN